MLEDIQELVVREKSALTLSYVMSTTSIYSDTGNTDDTTQDFTSSGGNEDGEWRARRFVAEKTGYISSIGNFKLGKTGSPDGSFYLEVYEDDGGTTPMPDTKVAESGASQTILCDDLNASGAYETFTWIRDCPFVEVGKTYWAVPKTIDYSYVDTTTEVWWRTDADGAVAQNECAKYDANASTKWTTMGADVGADLSVNMAKEIPLAPGNTMSLLVDFTKGSSVGVQMQLEFSHNEKDWFREGDDTTTSSVVTTAPRERKVEEDGNIAVEFGVLCSNYARLSSKALNNATGAELSVTALVGWK